MDQKVPRGGHPARHEGLVRPRPHRRSPAPCDHPGPRRGVKIRASCGAVEFRRLGLTSRVAGLESVAAAARVAILEWCAGAWPAVGMGWTPATDLPR